MPITKKKKKKNIHYAQPFWEHINMKHLKVDFRLTTVSVV